MTFASPRLHSSGGARDGRIIAALIDSLFPFMSLDIDKPWHDLSAAEVDRLTAQVGVYQIADADGAVRHIGYAGGRSKFGLRGELEAELARRGAGYRFRVATTSTYLSRRQELLMQHIAQHGRVPPENTDAGAKLRPLGIGVAATASRRG
jgi:hypothetical protein